MAGSVFTPEIASEYGALDDDAIADGGPASAQAVRTLVMSTHRLLAMGEPILSLMFDASEDAGGSGGLSARGYLNGFAMPNQWRRLYPAPLVVPKKQTHRKAEMKVVAQIETGRTCLIQLVTNGCAYNNDAVSTSPNVLSLNGNGNFATYSIADNVDHQRILLGPYSIESFELYVKAELSLSSLISTGTYGVNATGTAEFGVLDFTRNTFRDASSNWNTVGQRVDDGSVWVKFVNALNANELLTAPRHIVGVYVVPTESDATVLAFDPPMSLQEAKLCDGSTYELHHSPGYRIASVSINTEDLTG